jgi:hypothetical protein
MEEQEKLSRELESLKKVGRHTPPPEGYFDTLADEVMAQIRLDQVVTGHKADVIPPDYFEQLPEMVLEKVHAATPGGRMVIMRNLRWMAAAAVLVLVAVVMLKYVMPTNQDNEAKAAYVALSNDFSQDLTSDEIDHLIQSYNSEEDLWLLQQLEPVDHSELPEINGLESDEPLLQDILTDEEIEYLNEIM